MEPVAFDRNHYCIDITFYYRILADAVIGTCRPAALSGLAVFSKRAVLCGEDSRAHIFTSDTRIGEADGCTLSSSNRPTAVVEVLDPMVLSSKVKDACECGTAESVTVQIPAGIRALFDEDLVTSGDQMCIRDSPAPRRWPWADTASRESKHFSSKSSPTRVSSVIV